MVTRQHRLRVQRKWRAKNPQKIRMYQQRQNAKRIAERAELKRLRLGVVQQGV